MVYQLNSEISLSNLLFCSSNFVLLILKLPWNQSNYDSFWKDTMIGWHTLLSAALLKVVSKKLTKTRIRIREFNEKTQISVLVFGREWVCVPVCMFIVIYLFWLDKWKTGMTEVTKTGPYWWKYKNLLWSYYKGRSQMGSKMIW